jgi:hypothetical protein
MPQVNREIFTLAHRENPVIPAAAGQRGKAVSRFTGN